MKNKYYTPTIEEFHVGFEYEYQDGVDKDNKDVWKKTICTKSDFRYLSKTKIKDFRRVKYLDREDIESLGFTCYQNSNNSQWRFHKDNL